MAVVDLSPRRDNTTFDLPGRSQSVSGISLCVRISFDGRRVYAGGVSGVWRSDDGGETWTRAGPVQPDPAGDAAAGALLVPNVYDVLISPTDPDTVLAATGRDHHVPSRNGIWRSTNAGDDWTLVHQFLGAPVFGNGVGSIPVGGAFGLAVTPDDPDVMFAGSTFGVARSEDGGATWSAVLPPPSRAYYVAVGPSMNGRRDVYAAGAGVWHSRDGGNSWTMDPFPANLGMPANEAGDCSRSLAIHPTDSRVVYLAYRPDPDDDERPKKLWKGVFPDSGDAVWTSFVRPPDVQGSFSGTTYVVVHADPEGRVYHFHSDRKSLHLSVGEPSVESDWIRLDGNPIHVDPHGLDLTPDFRWAGQGTGQGRAVMINDGGAVVSDDGGQSWTPGRGLSTLNLVNVAVNPRVGGASITVQTGHNNGFFSADGGRTWRTHDYVAGDNDTSFADPGQPNRTVVFAPRWGAGEILLYASPPGSTPDGAFSTSQRQRIPGPPPVEGDDDKVRSRWNCVSEFVLRGYRPVVLTLADEAPRPGGDFITIIYDVAADENVTTPARLMRTTSLEQVTSAFDWVTTATTEADADPCFQQGPDLPEQTIDVVQASGGHDSPTFYVGGPGTAGDRSLWKWHGSMSSWEQIVPGTGDRGPDIAHRFFVDPYRPDVVYVIGRDGIHVSLNGGDSWSVDDALTTLLTDDREVPTLLSSEPSIGVSAVLRDMVFDRDDPLWRIAVGSGGVVQTRDGRTWYHLLRSQVTGERPMNAVSDPVSRPTKYDLYVATSNMGLVRVDARRPLTPLSLRRLATDCLGLPVPISVTDDVVSGVAAPRSLFERLREIDEDCN